jgi:anti-sigma factor RsiW
MTATELDPDVEDEIIATLSDYLDGALPPERKAEVESKLASDADWKRVHGELRETRDALSGLQKARAPVTFAEDVTGTIHKRSAGRFFGRRTLGDRVPFGVLIVVAILLFAGIGIAMHYSSTGSLTVDHDMPAAPQGSASDIKPRF